MGCLIAAILGAVIFVGIPIAFCLGISFMGDLARDTYGTGPTSHTTVRKAP